MTSSAIRQSFLDFFREKQHTIVPSSALLPDSPNLLFTNAGMNQFVPIFLGQAPCTYHPARAADTQKCIRAGGKHNDLEDVGFDTYHHTFFEMLGNWSFGDYFKKEAISWAWELVVERWKFPAERLYATVYKPGPGDPADFDQEAYDYWAKIFTAAGLDPAVHIVYGNKKDNFWMMGDTGPCGPCSELHVNLLPGPREPDLAGQKAGRELVNSGDARCIEIWNLVFIQFNANQDGTFVELPARHVDTGMGFERVCSMIQGTKGLTDFSHPEQISNYNTDVFEPLFRELETISGKKYGRTMPGSSQQLDEQGKIDVAFRVIADHVRTLSFSIADGIRPSNEGRGYVLRRILRRAVKYGRNLSLKEPFLGKLVSVLGETMGHIFPEVVAQADVIRKTLTAEEESFLRTLERGIELFEGVIEGLATIDSALETKPKTDFEQKGISRPDFKFPGNEAFKLFDTYGFPLDLTELMARERGMTVDVPEFNRLMEEQKARARAAQVKDVISVESAVSDELPATIFYGYDELQSVALVVANEASMLAVTETPFYAEMGGQVGDAGEVRTNSGKAVVTNTVKSPSGKVYFHKLAAPLTVKEGERVTLHVDETRRARIEAHHSGTHLLHWALRKVLGTTIGQKGSYVGPDRLRFDFSHGAAVSAEELAEIEKLVNEQIAANAAVKWQERPYAEVKGDPNILQFFGDKYGEKVRVVSIGDFSNELCGGTHVRQTSRIGYCKILSESAIAAGVRRIEAASGIALVDYIDDHLGKQEETLVGLRQRKGDLAALRAFSGEKVPRTYWDYFHEREQLLRQAAAEVAQFEKDQAKQQEALFQKTAAAAVPGLIATAQELGEIPFLAHEVKEMPAAYLPVLADVLKNQWQGVAVLAAVSEGKVALLCSVSPSFSKKVQAGKIIQVLAPLIGGKGGGRPELAQGGGTQPEGLPATLNKAAELVRGA